MSQSTIKDNINCFNTSNTSYLNVWNNCTVADDRSQLLAWLSPLEPRLRHRNVQERRVDNVGEWVMQTEEFRRWYDWGGGGEGDKAILFCYGDPGVGKTFISSLVMDRLSDEAEGRNTAVTGFYFDFAERKDQTATNVLGSLLKQIVSGMERIPDEISRAFQERKKGLGGREPQLPDIVKMLQTITFSQRTFMCIDAIDECAAVHRAKLLSSLKQILEKTPGTRIFVTGRPHIWVEIERRLAGRVRGVSVIPSQDDIVRYIRVRLDEDETPDAMDEILEVEILQRILENIPEMFLLVSINIEAILQESTIYRRRERLSKMTDGLGLGGAYDAMIERVKAQGGDRSRLGISALMWISHAERPLRVDELCHALAVELGSIDFDACNIPSMSTLISCCQGLITVDKEGSTVRLIHSSLQEYLSAHPDIFSTPHSTMAEMCLTYLNSKQVKALSGDISPDPQGTFFLEYCSVYWGVHAKRELSDNARSLALNLAQEDYGHMSTKFLLSQVKRLGLWCIDTWSPFSGLHCASFFGIAEIVAALIEMGCGDINRGDFLGYTPLAWAAHNGHEEIVKMLLELKGVNPDKPNNDDQTPLSFAALNGHEGVVRVLLGRKEVNPDKPDNRGWSPLAYAACVGREPVVKILLGREEVDPDKPSNEGGTPLWFAALRGREGVVKILLGRKEVSPDKSNNDGVTPLSCAAQNGHEGVVKMLLGRKEVDPDKPNNDGQTPLSLAAVRGHEGVVKTLLGRKEVDPDKPDNHGWAPLSYAASAGREAVVKILLGREGVDPDKPCNNGETPLSCAARCGQEGVVQILLGRKEVNPDKPCNEGNTPLSFAARNGYEGVVKILLGRKEVNPNKPDNEGNTPLLYAALYGYEGTVKILLKQDEANPDKSNNDGQTPLSFAALKGHGGVVSTLLGRKEVNPDKPDNDGRTPLLFAALTGHEEVVKTLLGRKEVNPDKPDNHGWASLSYAACAGHEGVVKILLGRDEVNPDKPSTYGETPLFFAALNGHEGVVEILLGLDKVNPDRPDIDGQTPLSVAAMQGHEGVVALLQSRKAVIL